MKGINNKLKSLTLFGGRKRSQLMRGAASSSGGGDDPPSPTSKTPSPLPSPSSETMQSPSPQNLFPANYTPIDLERLHKEATLFRLRDDTLFQMNQYWYWEWKVAGDFSKCFEPLKMTPDEMKDWAEKKEKDQAETEGKDWNLDDKIHFWRRLLRKWQDDADDMEMEFNRSDSDDD